LKLYIEEEIMRAVSLLRRKKSLLPTITDVLVTERMKICGPTPKLLFLNESEWNKTIHAINAGVQNIG